MPAIGERLPQWRALWGFSQRELARRADITNGALSKIEQGSTSPSIHTVQKIADAFGVDLQTLMFREPHPPFIINPEGDAPLLPLHAGTAGIYSFERATPAITRMQLTPKGLVDSAELLNLAPKVDGPLCDSDPLRLNREWLRLYVISGAVHLVANGRSAPLLAGDAACLPPKHPFTITCAEQPSELLLISPFSLA